jgi:hypothetical protein
MPMRYDPEAKYRCVKLVKVSSSRLCALTVISSHPTSLEIRSSLFSSIRLSASLVNVVCLPRIVGVLGHSGAEEEEANWSGATSGPSAGVAAAGRKDGSGAGGGNGSRPSRARIEVGSLRISRVRMEGKGECPIKAVLGLTPQSLLRLDDLREK